jgi:hypothetical protein
MTGAGVKFDARNLISITTRKQFVDALNELKDAAGKTVRGLAEETKIPQSTVGGYFSGRHVPAPKSAKAFGKVLRACGVPEDNVGAWVAAAARVRRNAGHHRRQVPTQRGRAKSADGEPARPEAPAVPVAFDAPVPAMWQPAPLGPGSLGAATPLARSVLVSLSPPLGRLDREPMLRGRDQLLGELTSALTGSGPRTYVLHGLGGVGKSTVALTLSQHAERLGHSVWWIAADSEAVLVTGMHALAVELGASPEQLRGSSPDVVWRLLEAQSRPWLLILDNADRPDETLAGSGGDVTDGNGWLRAPRRGQGMVLVTTRDGTRATWGDPPPAWLRLRSVSGLSAEDGAAVLLDLAGPAAGSRSDAEHLVTLLGGLPLGLRLLGQFVSRGVVALVQPYPGEIGAHDQHGRMVLGQGPLLSFQDNGDLARGLGQASLRPQALGEDAACTERVTVVGAEGLLPAGEGGLQHRRSPALAQVVADPAEVVHGDEGLGVLGAESSPDAGQQVLQVLLGAVEKAARVPDPGQVPFRDQYGPVVLAHQLATQAHGGRQHRLGAVELPGRPQERGGPGRELDHGVGLLRRRVQSALDAEPQRGQRVFDHGRPRRPGLWVAGVMALGGLGQQVHQELHMVVRGGPIVVHVQGRGADQRMHGDRRLVAGLQDADQAEFGHGTQGRPQRVLAQRREKPGSGQRAGPEQDSDRDRRALEAGE